MGVWCIPESNIGWDTPKTMDVQIERANTSQRILCGKYSKFIIHNKNIEIIYLLCLTCNLSASHIFIECLCDFLRYFYQWATTIYKRNGWSETAEPFAMTTTLTKFYKQDIIRKISFRLELATKQTISAASQLVIELWWKKKQYFFRLFKLTKPLNR